MSFNNEIVDEIHKIREEYSKLFDHDLDAIFADLCRQQSTSKRKIVRLTPKRSLTKRWSGADESFKLMS